MEWKNVHLRFEELEDGDVVVARLIDDCSFNYTGFSLAIYFEGELYDHFVKEDNDVRDHLCLTNYWDREKQVCLNIVSEYLFTGENVENINSPVLL